MMKRFFFFVVHAASLLSFILAGSPTWAATLGELMEKAVAGSRDMKKIAINLRNGENEKLLSEIAYRPNFGVSLTNKGLYQYTLGQKVTDLVSLSASRTDDRDSATDGVTSYTLSLDLRRLDRSDLLAARLNYNLDLLTFAAEREKFKMNVIKQFYDLVLALEEYKVLENSCSRWRDMLNYARAKYELGLANKIDYLNSEVNLGNAQNALLLQGQTVERLKEQFLDLIGEEIAGPGTHDVSLSYDLKFEPLDSAEIKATLASPSADCVREDVEAEKVRLAIAETKHSKAVKNSAPKVKLNLNRTEYENPATASNFTTTVTYSFTPGVQDTRVTEWTEANNLELRKIALADLGNSVLIEQRDAARRLLYLEEAYAIASKNLSQAEENLEFSTLSFQKGLISNIDLRDAQDKLTAAKRTAINLTVQYKVAERRFRFAMGKDL